MIEKNVLLFWDREPVPEGYAEAMNYMNTALPDVRLVSLNDDTAAAFLDKSYGRRHKEAFEACTHPAMRSDLVRLAWIAEHGGLYVDWRFRPLSKAHALFEERAEELIGFTMQVLGHTVVANGVFMAPAHSPAVTTLRDAAFENVWQRREGTVSDLTGPGLFTRFVDDVQDANRVCIFDRKYFFENFFENTQRGQREFGKEHWFTQNIFNLSSLYRD